MKRRRASAQPAPTPPSHKPNTSRETTSQPASFGASLAHTGADPLRLTPADVLRLQRTVGNAATIRMLDRTISTQATATSSLQRWPYDGGAFGGGGDSDSGENYDQNNYDDDSSSSSSDEGSESEEEAPYDFTKGTSGFQYRAKFKHVNKFEKSFEYKTSKDEKTDSLASLQKKLESQKATEQYKNSSFSQILQTFFKWPKADIDKYVDPADENKWNANAVTKVEYLGENDRKNYLVQPGGAMKRGTAPFSTGGMFSNGQGANFGIFVMSPNGEFYSNSHKVGLFHHTSFLEGMPTAGAGEWKTDSGGKLLAINNKSGHYQTGTIQFAQVLKALEAAGVNLAGVDVRLVDMTDFQIKQIQKWDESSSESEEEGAPQAAVQYYDAYAWLHDSYEAAALDNKESLPDVIENNAGAQVSVNWFEKGREFESAKGEGSDSSSFLDDKIRLIPRLNLNPDKGDDRVKGLKLFKWSDEDVAKYTKDGKWREDSVPKVEYLNENDRELYRVQPGMPMMRGATLFKTADMTTNKSGDGFGIFVMSPEKQFFSNSHKVGLFHHTSFLEAMPTAGAGEWQVDAGGTLKVITNKSGHYQTGKPQFVETLKALQAAGISLAGVEVRLFDQPLDPALVNDPDSPDCFLTNLGAKAVK